MALDDALTALQPFIAHVHLKGYTRGIFCGFGVGDVDLIPAIRSLIASGYAGAFTVEYEGPGDRTKELVESVDRARIAVQEAQEWYALRDSKPIRRDFSSW